MRACLKGEQLLVPMHKLSAKMLFSGCMCELSWPVELQWCHTVIASCCGILYMPANLKHMSVRYLFTLALAASSCSSVLCCCSGSAQHAWPAEELLVRGSLLQGSDRSYLHTDDSESVESR